jgi:hypothetical protein
MLAYTEWEESRCPICGGAPEECQSPDADADNMFATWIYRPKLPRVCHVGTAIRKFDPPAHDKRAFIPQVVKQRRGTPAPRLH